MQHLYRPRTALAPARQKHLIDSVAGPSPAGVIADLTLTLASRTTSPPVLPLSRVGRHVSRAQHLHALDCPAPVTYDAGQPPETGFPDAGIASKHL
ncbi:hypothetical protein ACJ41O_001113 [Fusarium nematophilum]